MSQIFKALGDRVTALSSEATLLKTKLSSGDKTVLSDVIPLSTRANDIKQDMKKELTNMRQLQNLSAKVQSDNSSAASNVAFYLSEVIAGIQAIKNFTSLVSIFNDIFSLVSKLQSSIITDLKKYEAMLKNFDVEQAALQQFKDSYSSLALGGTSLAASISTSVFSQLASENSSKLTSVTNALSDPKLSPDQKKSLLLLQSTLLNKQKLLG